MSIRSKLIFTTGLLLGALLINLLLLGLLAKTSMVAFDKASTTNKLLTTTIQMQADIRGAEAALYRYLIEGEKGFANQFKSNIDAFGVELLNYQTADISENDILLVNKLFSVYEQANEFGNTMLSLHDEQQINLHSLINQQTELTDLLNGEINSSVIGNSILIKALNEIKLSSHELGQSVTTYLIFPEENQRLGYTQSVIKYRKNIPIIESNLKLNEEKEIIENIKNVFLEFEQTGLLIISNYEQQQALFANFADVFYLSGQEILLGSIQPSAQKALLETEIQLQQAMLVSVGGSLGIAFIVLIFAVRFTLPLIKQIRENLTDLAKAAERVAEGDFKKKVDINEQDDELGSLTLAMNLMMNEISGREDKLQTQISEFEILRKINLELTRSLDLEKVLKTIVSSALHLVNASEVHIYLQDEGNFNPELKASAWANENHPPARMPLPDGLVSNVAMNMKLEVLNKASESDKYPKKNVASRGILARAAFPLIDNENILGVFYITYNDRDYFTDDDLRILQLLVDQATVALQNARLFKGIQDREIRIHEMAQKMMTVQEAERRLVGLDLHDGLTQLLLSINMHLNTLASLPLSFNNRGEKEFATVRSLIQEAIDEVRLVVSELRPSELNEDGFVESIRQYLIDSNESRNWETELNVTTGVIEVESMVEIATFRIIQEALNNAYKHGKAKKVRVNLSIHESELFLSIKDWGTGFTVSDLVNDDEKLGLIGMKERATLLNGKYNVNSEIGEGTEITVNIPLTSEFEEV